MEVSLRAFVFVIVVSSRICFLGGCLWLLLLLQLAERRVVLLGLPFGAALGNNYGA